MAKEIYKMMVLSSGHISESTMDCFEMHTDGVPVHYEKGEYGWFVVVPERPYGELGDYVEDPAACPEDLKRVLAYARAEGCEWLCFDMSGPVMADLPTFDW